jgi:8-oxo-dGTP pyrophosphatase MutT (NUDIX family)
MEITRRPSVRVVCLDSDHRVLLQCWRDPTDGTLLWEPPGGGIEPGETPRDTACRELSEETGFDPAAIGELWIAVERDVRWNGRRFVGTEQFFVAHVGQQQPEPSRAGLLPDEQVNLVECRWFTGADLATLPDRLEPPHLARVLAELDPNGPWRLPSR